MSLPRLRLALRFALLGLALALALTCAAAGPFAPFLLLGLWPVLVPAVLAGLLFAGGAGDWLERRRLAARWWAGALLGLGTLAASATVAGLSAWVLDGADNGPGRHVSRSLEIALLFGGAPAAVVGLLYARQVARTRGVAVT